MAGLSIPTSEVKRIFDTMEYGPAPEAENAAKVLEPVDSRPTITSLFLITISASNSCLQALI